MMDDDDHHREVHNQALLVLARHNRRRILLWGGVHQGEGQEGSMVGMDEPFMLLNLACAMRHHRPDGGIAPPPARGATLVVDGAVHHTKGRDEGT